MKIDWNNKYNTIAVYSFITGAAVIAFYLFISELNISLDRIKAVLEVLNPFIIGFMIAYILNFILKFIENRIFIMGRLKDMSARNKRYLALILTYLLAFMMVGLFFKFVFPQVAESIAGIINDIPQYIYNLSRYLLDIIARFNLKEEYTSFIEGNFADLSTSVTRIVRNILPVLGDFIKIFASRIWNIVLGTIISIYMLIDKERFCAIARKTVYAVFSKKRAERTLEIVNRSNDTFGRFIIGKILDSFIIGILTFVVLIIFKMPFAILVAFIVGVTNVIPFFGPFIGAVPSFIIILFVSPLKSLWFLIIILIIQQVDGNIIGPKILGDSIGISAFWILFSIIVSGKLFGFMGMLIGVPLFAIIYSIIKENIEYRLNSKGMDIDTEKYMK